MQVIRFITEDEYNILKSNKKVRLANKEIGSFNSRDKLTTYSLEAYSKESYKNIADYASWALWEGYDYIVTINIRDDDYEETYLAYSKEEVDRIAQQELDFETDNTLYAMEVYIVPEVKIDSYNINNVIKIEKVRVN